MLYYFYLLNFNFHKYTTSYRLKSFQIFANALLNIGFSVQIFENALVPLDLKI